MNQKLLYIFTRTPLHVGAGSSVGAVDLPVQRERHTGHPIIPGSSIKGVIRYMAETLDERSDVTPLFGSIEGDDAKAGDLTFGGARPLAFPVRSAKGAFAYITSPIALQRWAREAGIDNLPDLSLLDDQTCQAGSKVLLTNNKVVLEEYAFTNNGAFPTEWEEALKNVIADPVWKEAIGRLVLLSDGDFSHFVKTTTEINHHNKIDATTGTVAQGALFNIESVPAETLFFAPVISIGRYNKSENVDSMACMEEIAQNHPVMQFGGHSTTGLGFCTVKLG
jgi:CRISPR-associated protein Cmr4